MTKKIISGEVIEERSFTSSSSNSVYNTILYNNCVSCTCPAGCGKQICKHMREVVYDNKEFLEKEYTEFYEKILSAFEIQNDKYLSQDDKKKFYAEVIYAVSSSVPSFILYSFDYRNVDKHTENTVKRAEKFITTTKNCFLNLKEALKADYITQEQYDEKINESMQSIKMISESIFDN